MNQMPRRKNKVGAVRAERASGVGVSNSITGSNPFDTFADLLDDTRGLYAHAIRQWHWILTGSVIVIGEIEANRMVAHLDFTNPWLSQVHLPQLKDFRSTWFVKANGIDHRKPLISTYFHVRPTRGPQLTPVKLL